MRERVENGKENSRELKNNDDIPQFLSPCLPSHYAAATLRHNVRGISQLKLGFVIICGTGLIHVTGWCTNTHTTHTHAEPPISQTKTSSGENYNQKRVERQESRKKGA